VFVRFKRCFHPSEARVNRVATRAWFQDSFGEFRGVGPKYVTKFQVFFVVETRKYMKGDSNDVCRLF
jgi:hypothetical protein